MEDSCCHPKPKADYFFWGLVIIAVCGYGVHALYDLHHSQILGAFTHAIFEFMNKIWIGLLIGIAFVGILARVPREVVVSLLGKGDSFSGILRATIAGVLFDMCSHGILMVGMKLYERGASIGQVMAFLIASPWNSISLTIILYLLIGLPWTLAFIALSVVIACVTGVIFNHLVAKGVVAANPQKVDVPKGYSVRKELFKDLSMSWFSFATILNILKDGLLGSKVVIKWALFGVILTAIIRESTSVEWFESYFGPTVIGLGLTLLATTIIEVCSEGAVPLASDLMLRANAPGNSFVFLMAGVSTDYTEIMAIKETTRSWKVAMLLPCITVPQIMLVGWLLNSYGI